MTTKLDVLTSYQLESEHHIRCHGRTGRDRGGMARHWLSYLS